ncbi:MAG: glycosyltransferase family 2 protein, partial [Ignavibacteriaceae bacterium]|nr:glycosyltransferase family 2 protein [Ignavibacteriaceae bacterium]
MYKFNHKISLVILNWNGIDYLKTFLPFIIQYSNIPGVTIVVADNGSTDDSVNYIESHFPSIQLICLDKNYGFTGGYNRALQQLNSEYYILLNSDVEVSENWIEPVIKIMDEDTTIAAAMPKILSYSDRHKFEYAGASGGFIDKLGYPFCRGRIIGDIEEDKGQYNDVRDIFWASGTAMFIRSELFIGYGGLDEDFFAHMEELDLCWRLKNGGYRIVVVPDSVVYHVGGGTLPNNTPRKIYLNYRNNIMLLLKNLESIQLIPIILTRMILDGFSACVYLLKMNFSFFWSVIKAHMSFYL